MDKIKIPKSPVSIKLDGNENIVAGGDVYITNNLANNLTDIVFDPLILAEIISEVADNLKDYKGELDDFTRPGIDKKNTLNNVSEEFYSDVILDATAEFAYIDLFMKDPNNREYVQKYKNIVMEIKGEIHNYMKDNKGIQDILPSVLNYAKKTSNSKDLKERSHWVQILGYYMYVNCDIGRKYND